MRVTNIKSGWCGLAALSLGMVLLFMNTTMINVALPALASGLGASGGELEWIVSSYNLASLSVLLLGGALGDRFGHRRLLLGGIVAFIAGAVLAAVAKTVIVLLAARVVMGLAASVFTPMSLALIPRLFPSGRCTVATAIWTAAGAVGAPFGPLVGGPMIDRWGWRAVFWLDIVVAVLVLGLCLVFVPGGRARAGERPLPLAQIVISASGFSLLTWGLINAERTWAAPTTWGPLAVGVVLLVVFVLLETRSGNRLTDLGLLADRRFRTSVLVLMLISCVLFGILFVAPSYLQTVLGNNATTGGMMLMPVALTAVIGAVVAGWLARFEALRELILPIALVFVAAGLWLCATSTTSSGYSPMFWGLLTAGMGLGVGQSRGITSGMSAVPDERGGAGAALLNGIRQLGAVLGVALFGSLTGNCYAAGVAGTAGKMPGADGAAIAQSIAAAFAVADGLPAAQAASVRAAASGAYVAAVQTVFGASALVAAVAAAVLATSAAVRGFVQSRP